VKTKESMKIILNKQQLTNAFIMLIPALIFIFILPGKTTEKNTLQIFDVFDTYSEITITGKKNADSVLEECNRYLHEKDTQWSHTNTESEIHLLNSRSGKESSSLSADTVEILKKGKEGSVFTNGYFDITVGAAVDLWGIGTDDEKVPAEEEISEVIHKIGNSFLEIGENSAYIQKEGVSVTLGAIAKGFATDELVKILKKHNVTSALLNLGGNIYALGNDQNGEAWKIGIQDPIDAGKLICTLKAYDTSVVTSGSYQRYFEKDGIKYHHIINPFTGMPAKSGLTSVTIVSPDATLADVLSTACFVIGFDEGASLVKELGAMAVFVTENNTVYYSDGLESLIEYDNPGYEYKKININ